MPIIGENSDFFLMSTWNSSENFRLFSITLIIHNILLSIRTYHHYYLLLPQILPYQMQIRYLRILRRFLILLHNHPILTFCALKSAWPLTLFTLFFYNIIQILCNILHNDTILAINYEYLTHAVGHIGLTMPTVYAEISDFGLIGGVWENGGV